MALQSALRGMSYARRRPRRKAYRKRKARIPRMNALSRMPRNRIHFATFRVQMAESDTMGVYNTKDALGAPITNVGHIAVRLNMFPRTQNYIRLYNTYKICKVKYEFIPVQTRSRIEGTAVGIDSNIPTFTTLINRQSTSFPGNLNQALSVPYAKQTNAGKYHTHYFTPVTFDAVYRAAPALTNALNPEYAQYLQVEYADVNHHGVSWVMSPAGNNWAANAFEYRVVATIYVAFKGIKVDVTA